MLMDGVEDVKDITDFGSKPETKKPGNKLETVVTMDELDGSTVSVAAAKQPANLPYAYLSNSVLTNVILDLLLMKILELFQCVVIIMYGQLQWLKLLEIMLNLVMLKNQRSIHL